MTNVVYVCHEEPHQSRSRIVCFRNSRKECGGDSGAIFWRDVRFGYSLGRVVDDGVVAPLVSGLSASALFVLGR